MDLVYRPRRLRHSAPIRGLVRETELSPRQLIYPMFVTEGKKVREHIDTMPGFGATCSQGYQKSSS